MDALCNSGGENRAAQGRVEYIDLFRGIGVLLMILGHLGLGMVFDHYIHAFHMPMFFVISGYFFRSPKHRSGGTAAHLLRKCRTLLLPYAVFGLGFWVLNILMGGEVWRPLQHLLFVNTIHLPITGALWFLTALFVTEAVYHLLVERMPNPWGKTLLAIVLALAGNYLPSLLSFRLPYAMDAGLVGVGLFHAGRLLRDAVERKTPAARLLSMNKLSAVAVLLASGVLIFVNNYINMRGGKYGIVPLFWINALAMTIAGMNLCRSFGDWTAKNGRFRRARGLLLRMGRNSIVYLCTNEFFLYGWERLLKKLPDAPAYINKILTFVLAMACMILAERILVNTRLRVLIGKK